MKKSEIYRLAQCCIVSSISLSAEQKLEILRVLMEQEDVALYVEKTDTEMRKEAGEVCEAV